MQCSGCRAPVREDATACAGCGADLSYTSLGPDGKQYGPYALAAVKSYLQEGRLGPDSQVSRAGGPWVPITQALQEADGAPARPAAPRRASSEKNPLKVVLIVVGVLVGVGVLGIVGLMLILGPVLGRAGSQAATSSCLSNLKQVGLGMHMLAMDYDNTFPDSSTWTTKVEPYTKDQSVFTCPGTKQTYEMNPYLSGVKLEQIPRMAEVPLVYDAGFPNGDPPHARGWCVVFADGHAKTISESDAAQYQ